MSDNIAIELLFQKIQLELCKTNSDEKTIINFFEKTLNRLEKHRERKSIKEQIRNNLESDWELETYYYYLYPEGSFNNLVKFFFDET